MMNNIDILLDAAFQDYNIGEYGQAEQKTREALMLSPTHGDALYLLGLIAYKKGIWTEAIDVLSLLTKLYPDYQNYRLALAEVYQNHGEIDKAKELYLTVPQNPKAMAAIGWIELEKGNRKEAEKIFQENPVAESFLGLAELSEGKERLTYLKKAQKLEETPRVLKALTLYYLSQKKYKEVQKYLKKLPHEKYLKALFLKAQNHLEEALYLLKELTIENAFQWEVWLTLAQVAEESNDASLAESAYRRVLDLKRDCFFAGKALARLLMKESRLSEAVEIYQKLARDNPQDKEILLAVALILDELGETLEALGLYFNLLSLGQKGLTKTIEKAIRKLAQTDHEAAQRFAEGWAKHFPENKIAQKLLKIFQIVLFCLMFLGGGAWAQMPIPDENLEFLWQSKMAAYGDPKGQYQLGKVYEEGKVVPKDLGKAIYYYQLSAKQNFLPAAMQLGRIFLNEKAVMDEEKSLQWYIFAANRGDMQAENYLFHYYDEAAQPDKEKAFYWLEKMLKEAFPKEKNLARVSADYERLKKELMP